MEAAMFNTVATAHNEAIKRGVLNIWTIFDHPLDFPNDYVARRFEVGAAPDPGETRATDDVIIGELRIIRTSFRRCGLTCLKRSDADEPQIIESWL
jgi:hypothetical protein